MFYRVTFEHEIIVEAASIKEAEDKAMRDPYKYRRVGTEMLDQTVPCDKDGKEIEEAEA